MKIYQNTTSQKPLIKDLGALWFNGRKLPLNLKTIAETLGATEEEIKSLNLPPNKEMVTNFPYRLKMHLIGSIILLKVTDENCIVAFNQIDLKPGVGDFLIFRNILGFTDVNILNHQEPLEIHHYCLDDETVQLSGTISLNCKIDDKTYCYESNCFGIVDKPRNTIIRIDDMPIGTVRTEFIGGLIESNDVDLLDAANVTQYCHGKIHNLTYHTSPPYKCFVIHRDHLQRFLAEARTILPNAKFEGFNPKQFLRENIYAEPEKALVSMQKQLEEREHEIQTLLDSGLVSKDP